MLTSTRRGALVVVAMALVTRRAHGSVSDTLGEEAQLEEPGALRLNCWVEGDRDAVENDVFVVAGSVSQIDVLKIAEGLTV